MQVKQFGIWLQTQCKLKNSVIANLDCFEVICGIFMVSVVFFVKL